MGKFETKREIFGLFLGAAGVAALLILFINAEVKKRATREIPIENRVDENFMHKISTYLRTLYDHESSAKARSKRSAEDNEIDRNFQNEIEATESLLSEDVTGHQIRHLDDKIRQLGEKSMLVRSVLRVYCVKETYYMTNMLNCTGTAGSQNEVEDETKSKSEDQARSVHHQPLLDEDVFTDARTEHQRHSPLQSSPVHLSCSVQTVVIVFITTLSNLFLLLLSLGAFKLCRLIRSQDYAQDKVWLVEEDLRNLYDEPTEPVVGKISMVA